jgi:LuxR family maltose regulon positive regulatory protein
MDATETKAGLICAAAKVGAKPEERWMESNAPKAIQNIKSATAELLTERESNIIDLIARGQSNKEIARNLGISPETVKSHVKRIFTKLNVGKRAQAVSRVQIPALAGTQR